MLAVVAALCACAAASSGRADEERDLSAYAGLATWVDLYDPQVLKRPESSVAAMAENGVQTLFFETSNYQMRRDIVRPDRVARFIEAAHAEGMQVVAWYLPSLTDLNRDLRRSLAAVNFKTPDGEQFDSFGLDIEATLVRSPTKRNERLLTLTRRIRAAVPQELALGAIVPSPVGMRLKPSYWPRFPFAQLARSYDVFLPMGYFTYRRHYPRRERRVHAVEHQVAPRGNGRSRAAGARDRRHRRRCDVEPVARVPSRGADGRRDRRGPLRLRAHHAAAVDAATGVERAAGARLTRSAPLVSRVTSPGLTRSTSRTSSR